MMFWVIELISLTRTLRVRRIYALLKNETQKILMKMHFGLKIGCNM